MQEEYVLLVIPRSEWCLAPSSTFSPFLRLSRKASSLGLTVLNSLYFPEGSTVADSYRLLTSTRCAG